MKYDSFPSYAYFVQCLPSGGLWVNGLNAAGVVAKERNSAEFSVCDKSAKMKVKYWHKTTVQEIDHQLENPVMN